MKLQSSDSNFDATSSTKHKYCPTLERLGLVQNSFSNSPTFDIPIPQIPRSPSRPPLVRSKSSSYLRPTTRRTKKGGPANNDQFSSVDAQWYLKLPQKVQKKHFTRDEQFLLAGYRGFIGLETPFRLPQQTSRRPSEQSVPSLRPSTSSTLSSESSLYWEARQDPAESVFDMDDLMMDELRWMDEQNIDLRLDDYHIHVIQASSPRKSWSSHRRPSFRRDPTSPISPTNPGATTRQPASRIATPIQDTFPASISSIPPSPKTHNRRETQNFLPIHQNRPSTDSSTTRHYHYQDPEARLKLRVWLASTSKFDEAIEHGFPSLEDPKDHQETTFPIQGRPSLSSHHFKTAPAVSQTFFDDSSPSVFNAFDSPSDEDDTSSLPDLEMPRTPSPTALHTTHRLPTTSASSSSASSSTTSTSPFSPSTHPSSELQSSLKPKLRYLAPDGSESRQMTLRMTLTRPDLRDKEDVGKWGVRKDPLALEELPRGEDGRVVWDEKDGSKGRGGRGVVGRMWRRVSGRD